MTTAVAQGPRLYGCEGNVAEEDRARADIYGVLAHLFYSSPSASLLRTITDVRLIEGDADQSPLAAAWHELQKAARAADPEAIREEYDHAFITAGRPPVFLYGSVYQTGFLMDKPLARLRDDLAQLGFARNLEVGEPEDHISALCDVMRLLIIGTDDAAPAALSAQREFFMRHIAPWYERLCAAIDAAEQTDFYKKAAAFAKEFFYLEVQSFEIA
jgi:TorA maturation chaperone TorD